MGLREWAKVGFRNWAKLGGCKGGIQGGRKEESKEVREQSRVGAKRRECKGESKTLNSVRSTFGKPYQVV